MSAAVLPAAPGVSEKESKLSPLSPSAKGKLTFAEYMEIERASEVRHHFIDGEMIAMAGASFEHNCVNANLMFALGIALEESDCRVLGSDQKIYLSERRGYYPDTVVVCGQPKIAYGEALQNPVLIAEILSPSTALFDRGDKFRDYRAIASLEHYLLIEQDKAAVEHFRRNSEGKWVLNSECNALDQTLELTIGGASVSLSLTKIYRNVTFPEAEPDKKQGE